MKFTTVQMLKSRKMNNLLACLTQVFQMYLNYGYRVKFLLTDKEFEPIRDSIMESHRVILNATSANEHVPEVEREIRSVKDKTRSCRTTLPFTIMPFLMVLACCKYQVYWMNMFPRTDGLSTLYGPRIFMQQHHPDYKTMCKLEFGAYCEIHNDPKPSNTMTP